LACLVYHRIERLPIGHRAVGLVGLAGLADGGVEVGPLLGFVLGFGQVADGAEAVGVPNETACEAFEHDADLGHSQRVTAERAEDGIAAAQTEAGPRVEPALDDSGGPGIQSDGPLSSAFAVEHANAAVGEFEVLGVEGEGFVDAQAGAVEQGDRRGSWQA